MMDQVIESEVPYGIKLPLSVQSAGKRHEAHIEVNEAKQTQASNTEPTIEHRCNLMNSRLGSMQQNSI